MLNKLALRNAKRSFRDYLIYLLTMIFTAALMFSFDSMIFSDDVKKLCSEAGMMGAMLGLATFFIVLIMIWLVHYMMKFMAEKRSREFATYLLLGFHKKQIARLFLKEMLLLGLAAFFIGLLPGLFFRRPVLTGSTWFRRVHPPAIPVPCCSHGYAPERSGRAFSVFPAP